jgi:HSP20 family protein
MAIARWSPGNELAGLHSAMDRLFSDVFGPAYRGLMTEDGGREGGRRDGGGQHLPVNIAETDTGYRIEAPLPGVRPEDVEITFQDGVLTINAKRSEEREQKERDYVRREVVFGNFRRQIALPGDVQAENIKANFDNGVLTIEVPRARRPEPSRIQVQAGQQAKQLTGEGARRS